MASRAPPIYTCDRHDRETGQPCGLSTKRKSNLDRHIRRKHPEAQPATFQPIQYLVNELGVLHQARTSTAEQTCRAPLPPAPPLPPSHSAPPLACASLNRNLDISFSCSDPSADRLLSGRPHTAISAAHSPPSSGLTSPSHDLAGPSPGRAVAQEPVPVRVADGPTALSTEPTLAITAEGPTGNVVASCVRTSTEHLAADTAGHAPAPTTSGAHASWEEHKSTTRKRLAGSLAKETLPVYGTKRSKKWPLQQRAIGWMTQAGKAHFDHHLAMLLGQWGVSQEHRGTCVLLPAAWAALDPLRLVTMFSAETCPLAFDDRMVRRVAPTTRPLLILRSLTPTRIMAPALPARWPGSPTTGLAPASSSITFSGAGRTSCDKAPTAVTIPCALFISSLRIRKSTKSARSATSEPSSSVAKASRCRRIVRSMSHIRA